MALLKISNQKAYPIQMVCGFHINMDISGISQALRFNSHAPSSRFSPKELSYSFSSRFIAFLVR